MKLFFEGPEPDWEKEQGLKPTNMWTVGSSSRGRKGSSKRVYKAKDGRLYYQDHGHWNGTFYNYCFGTDEDGRAFEFETDKESSKVYVTFEDGKKIKIPAYK